MMMSRLRFGFLFEVFYGELRFANHEQAARAQTENRRRTSKDREGSGSVVENGLAIVSANRTADGDERGGGKQSEAGVEAAQGFYEELRTQVQGSQLFKPDLMVGRAGVESGELRGHDARAIDNAREAVAGTQRQNGRGVCEDGGGHDGS